MLGRYDSINKGNRIKKVLTDKEVILKIVNQTTAYYGKSLLRSEIEGLIGYIREINYTLLENDDLNTIIIKVAKNFTNQLRDTQKGGLFINTHELMKGNMGNVGITDISDVFVDSACIQQNPSLNLKSGKELVKTAEAFSDNYGIERYGGDDDRTNSEERQIKNAILAGVPPVIAGASTSSMILNKKFPQSLYLLLDSKFRNLTTDQSVYRWSVSTTTSVVQGTVNTMAYNVQNIINMQFDQFQIPYVKSADNVYRKISLFVQEFSSMAVIISASRRYHMLFSSNIVGNQLELTPNKNDDGTFRFSTPINNLDTLTLIFQSPFSPVVFQKDRYTVIITPINITESLLTFSEAHGVTDTELVLIEEFTTQNPSVDYIQINEMNKEIGQTVTFLSDTQLIINVDISGTTMLPISYATCFIAARRIIIPVRMEYLP
jgi:hypothetical protein